MKVLYVITARGGSKGVPHKNIIEIGGLPLVGYKIISAKRSEVEKRIIVSTDDNSIADVSKKYGAEVPFIRPDNLASDTASSMDVIKHAMNWVEHNDSTTYDYVCMLEPSSPFMTYEQMNEAFRLIEEKKGDTLLGVKEVGVSRRFIHPLDNEGLLSYHFKAIRNMKSVRRQDQEREYTMNGCIYVARYEYFKKYHLFHSDKSIPYIMSETESVEIDSQMDLEFARYLVDNNIIDLSCWK